MDMNKKYKVLIVEDEPLIRNYLAQKIPAASSQFVVVGKAQTGKEALETILKTAPNVIFTDIRMPEMSGLELANQVHSLYPDIVVVILTGYADFTYAQEAIRYQVFAYLLKPLNVDDLKDLLARLSIFLSKTQKEIPEEQSIPNGISPQKTFELIKEYMRLNYQRQIDLQILAKQFNYSPAYIIKLFKKYENTTPNRYLIQLRINAACQLLINETIPIAQVGERVGYHDLPYFSKLFKQHKELGPAAYRAMYSKNTAKAHEDNGK